MKNKILKTTLWLISAAIALLATIYLVAWKSPAYYPPTTCTDTDPRIIPFSRYDSISDHPRPLILQNANVVVFGATHTRDPLHPEIAEIEFTWEKLNPTIALVEGRLDFLLPVIMDPVKNLGEGGKVKQLAMKSDVPLYNWDLSKEELAKQLKRSFTAEQIALAQILNPYFSNLRFGKPASPENFISEYLHRASFVGLEKKFTSADDVDREWKLQFPTGPDWRDVSDEYGLPGYLANYMSATNDIRNNHLVCTIQQLVAKGERVYVICGSSHAACIEAAIKLKVKG